MIRFRLISNCKFEINSDETRAHKSPGTYVLGTVIATFPSNVDPRFRQTTPAKKSQKLITHETHPDASSSDRVGHVCCVYRGAWRAEEQVVLEPDDQTRLARRTSKTREIATTVTLGLRTCHWVSDFHFALIRWTRGSFVFAILYRGARGIYTKSVSFQCRFSNHLFTKIQRNF